MVGLAEEALDGRLRLVAPLLGLLVTLVALMDGLQGLWLLDPDSVDMAEELRNYLRPLITLDVEGCVN